jgi:DNA-3-methyladenine glycosylase I
VTAVAGPDGRLRCPWGLGAEDYIAYHDEEWGRPVTSVAGLYERITLEAFQSGLAWITILRKRSAFREAFCGFDPEQVARFGDPDVARLMSDPGIVRNLGKIEAAINNARVIHDWGDGFVESIWSYARPGRPRPADIADVPASTPESTELAASLKRRGIRFVGSTTTYAMMQAIGLVDDHLADCFVPPHPPARDS